MASLTVAPQSSLAQVSTADMRKELRRRTGLIRKSAVAKRLREGRRQPQAISEKAHEMNNISEERLSIAPSDEALKRGQTMLIIANFMFPRGPLTIAMNRLGAQPRRKSLNSFMAFRSFYSAKFTAMQQKEISGILKTIWENEPFKDRWAVIAEAYTLMRDLNGIHNAPLKDFATAVSRFVGVIQADEYLATLGWELVEEDGTKTVVKCFQPNLDNLNEYMKTVNRDVTQTIAFCYEQGLYNATMFQETNGKRFRQMRNIQKQQQAMAAQNAMRNNVPSPIDALQSPTLEEFCPNEPSDEGIGMAAAFMPQMPTFDSSIMSIFGEENLNAHVQGNPSPSTALVTHIAAHSNDPVPNTSTINGGNAGHNVQIVDNFANNVRSEGLIDFDVGESLFGNGADYLQTLASSGSGNSSQNIANGISQGSTGSSVDASLTGSVPINDDATGSEDRPGIISLGQAIPLNAHFHPDTTLDVVYDPLAGEPFQSFHSWEFGNLEAIAAFNTRFVPANEGGTSDGIDETAFHVNFDEFLEWAD